MEENSIDNAVTQFYEKKVDVPAEKVTRLFESLTPVLSKYGLATWQYQITPGRIVTGFPGGSYTQDLIYVQGLKGYQFFDIDKTIRNPELTANDMVALTR
jgi:hypothetical protein